MCGQTRLVLYQKRPTYIKNRSIYMYGKNPVAKAPTEQTYTCEMNAEETYQFPKKRTYKHMKRDRQKKASTIKTYIHMQYVSPPSNAPCIVSKETYICQKETWIHTKRYPEWRPLQNKRTDTKCTQQRPSCFKKETFMFQKRDFMFQKRDLCIYEQRTTIKFSTKQTHRREMYAKETYKYPKKKTYIYTKRNLQSGLYKTDQQKWNVAALYQTRLAAHCNTLQHAATYCNTLNTLQHAAALYQARPAAHCNTLQHTATHCNTLQHIEYTAAHCNTLQHTATHCNTLQHTATHCNTLQHTATHCNTL